tara:strand:- start:70 stop:495 length:426 start_codon:yes stop_codon:yes gene_type:complete
MKDIDIRWVKNRKTKNSSLNLVNRVPYNDYPEGTATVDLVGVTQKTPEAKIHFVFPEKKGECPEWDWKGNTVNYKNVNWSFYCLVSMIFNKIENDYDYYFNFYNGKEWARVNDKELADMITIIQIIKKDLNNLLTVNNFTK